MALPRMEIAAKMYHVRFYDKHEDRYSSSFQVFVDGDSGHIYGLNGNGFLKILRDFTQEFFTSLGVKYVFFYMMEETLAAFKGVAASLDVEELERLTTANRPMVKVRISLKA